ncbi:MAG TPA: cation:proton antiporter, partial [Nakamurella sp.]
KPSRCRLATAAGRPEGVVVEQSTGTVYAALGLATLLAALLPGLLRRVPISLPMVFLAAGGTIFALFPGMPDPDPRVSSVLTVYVTELCVIVSLMGAGLALNRPPGWRRWATTWRLLAITMPLSMLAVGVLGWGLLGLGVAASLLLAATLAPTDPVLATEVQVAEPVENPEEADDEARFALTSEAGLNDGLAFPFVYAAIAISLVGVAPGGWLGHWLAVDVAWRLGVAVLLGWATGRLLRYLFFAARSKRFRLAEQAEGFVALAATFLAYGITELVNGYGFVAVFVCACTIRTGERSHSYHRVLHGYVQQLERLLTVLIVILIGGAVTTGLLAGVDWREVLVALLFLLAVRPIAGLLGLIGGRTGPRERAVIAFFGVRGVGSLFYAAFAVQHGSFADEQHSLWRITTLVIVGSIVIHGLTATPVMYYLDRTRRRAAQAETGDPGQAPTTPV